MPTSLVAPLVILRSLVGSRVELQLENLALRHQIGVLQRSLRKRPKLTSVDLLLWASLSRMEGTCTKVLLLGAGHSLSSSFLLLRNKNVNTAINAVPT